MLTTAVPIFPLRLPQELTGSDGLLFQTAVAGTPVTRTTTRD